MWALSQVLAVRPGVLNSLVVCAALPLAGCAARSAHDRGYVSRGIETRTGYALGTPGAALPPEVALDDGLTEDEAVAVALWSNAAFQADLAALGVARADLAEAGLLRNPVLSLLFPIGPKQLEFTLTWPVEAIWQRPRRVNFAKLEVERVAERLVQNGLNLARDVRVAHADALLAERRARLLEENAALRMEIAGIADARLRAGDISELEASEARLDAARAGDAAARAARDRAVARDRLRATMGMITDATDFELTPSSNAASTSGEEADLLRAAYAARPDLRAAELAMESAAQRARWERSRIAQLSALLDFNQKGSQGAEAGPGVAAELPVLNWNQGGRGRADAEVERAARQYTAVRQRITLEVKESLQRYEEARESSARWQKDILPRLAEAAAITEKALAAGDVSYLAVLASRRALADAQLQAAEAEAALRRARAESERSVGRRGP